MQPFRFKQFTVQHQRSSMRVGTDAVLLGAWCDLAGVHRALDVGTGCGVIALMVAQRTACDCEVRAIDIDPDSVAEARENFAQSPWSRRLRVQQVDLNDYCDDKQFDIIVTNPPYHQEDVLPPDATRAAARHTHSLSFAQLMDAARRLLLPTGSLALITPAEASDAVTEAATFAGLHLSRLCMVHSLEGGVTKRVMWQWSRQPAHIIRETLALQVRPGVYTSDYTKLCQDFYLAF